MDVPRATCGPSSGLALYHPYGAYVPSLRNIGWLCAKRAVRHFGASSGEAPILLLLQALVLQGVPCMSGFSVSLAITVL